MPKQGPIYDLPIAMAILAASGQVPNRYQDVALMGELSMDGDAGALPGSRSIPMATHRRRYGEPGPRWA